MARRTRRRARHNYYSAGALVNRKRSHRRRARTNRRRGAFRRHFARLRRSVRRRFGRRPRHNVYMPLMNRKRHRRHYRSNPMGGRSIMGLPIPPLDAVLWVTAGFVAPPAIASLVVKYIPASWKNADGTMPAWMTWVVKVASILVPSMLVRRFVNRRAGNLMLVGGAANIVMDLIRTYAPGIIPGLGYQPLLGAYATRAPARTLPYRQNPRMLPPQVAAAPERLDPSARF